MWREVRTCEQTDYAVKFFRSERVHALTLAINRIAVACSCNRLQSTIGRTTIVAGFAFSVRLLHSPGAFNVP